MSEPISPTPEQIADRTEWIRPLAERARRSLELRYPAGLPEAISAELAAVKGDGPGSWLVRYTTCQMHLAEADRQADPKYRAEKRRAEGGLDELTLLMDRIPVEVELGTGRKVPIHSKSYKSYVRMGVLQAELDDCEEALAYLTEQSRFGTAKLRRRLLQFKERTWDRLLALCLHESATPPEDAPLPSWAEDLTHAEIVSVHHAHQRVGVMRLAILQDYEAMDAATGKPPENALRHGFGWFMLHYAKVRKTDVAALKNEDLNTLLADVYTRAADARAGNSDDEGLAELFDQ